MITQHTVKELEDSYSAVENTRYEYIYMNIHIVHLLWCSRLRLPSARI